MKQNNHPMDDESWRNLEKFLLCFLVICKCILFITRLNVYAGYDVDGHLQAMSAISWLHPFFDLRSFYYATHPPLGFLLADSIGFILLVPPLVAAQCVSFIASLTIVYFLRQTLVHLDLLKRPVAIAFLYLACGVPLESYMETSVNLDVIVFAFAAALLFLSVTIVHAKRKNIFSLPVLVAGLVVAGACLTKESGFVLFSLPFIVFAVFGKNLALQAKRFALILATAACFVFPYYYVNYYIPEKTFFFGNAGTTAWVQETHDSIQRRNDDPAGFVLSFVRAYDGNEPRLLRTWRALWHAEDQSPQSSLSDQYVQFYLKIGPWLAIAGLFLFPWLYKPKDKWYRLGTILYIFGFVELLFLITLITKYPIDGYAFNKGIYIAPASLAVCYMIASLIEAPTLLPKRFRIKHTMLQMMVLALVAVFFAANNLVPVY